MALVVAGATGAAAGASLRPAGDPGGRILAELSAVKGALPPHAGDVRALGSEPVITSSCDTTVPGVVERVSFDSDGTVRRVATEVATRMRQLGWRHYSAATGRWDAPSPGQPGAGVLSNNYIYRWSRRLPSGSTAAGSLQVSVPVRGWVAGDTLTWLLAASAMGIGEPHRRCGEG